MAGDFDLSARITADASGLVQAGAQGEAAYEGIGRAAKDAAAGAAVLENATEQVANAEAKAAAGASTMADAIVRAAARGAQAQREATKAANDAAAAANRQAFATRNLGQQFGDFATQVSLGGGVARAFASQAGQMGYALSDFGGRLGKVGAFLTGPWGIALTVGAVVLAPLVEKLFEGAEGAKQVELASSALSTAQSSLGDVFDLTTGKLKGLNSELASSNELLRINARLSAINLRTEAAKAEVSSREAFDSAGNISISDRFNAARQAIGMGGGFTGAIRGAISGTERGGQNAKNLRNVVAGIRSGSIKSEDALQAAEKIDFSGTGVDRDEFLGAIRDRVAADANRDIADLIDKSLDTGTLSSGLRRTGRTKKPPKPKSTAARDEFGRDAADKLAGIRESLDDTPEGVRKVNTQLRQLDDLIDDLARKKPPGFEKLIADARALEPLVRNSLNKPFDDYIEAQEKQLAVQALIGQGRIDEANALRVIQQLQGTMAPLTDQQKAAVLATTEAMRFQARQIDILREKNAKYVEAVGGIKNVVEDATQAFVRGDLGQLLKSPQKLLDVFQTFQGRKLFDNLFGDAFRDLEDQANGTSVVRESSERMATAVDNANRSIGSLGDAAANAARQISGGGLNGVGLAAAAAAGTPTSAADLNALLAGYRGPTGPTDDGGTTTVVGRRDPIVSSLSKVGEKIAGIFTNPDNAKNIGQSIGRFAGKGLEGAATGTVVAGIGKALGFKVSTTGAQIGGAIGSALPIPGGQVIGSIAGGLIGGLFKTSKTGSASIGNVDGVAGITGTGGNNSGLRKAASGLAGSINDTLTNIVSTLGGTLGNFSVSIGQRDGKFVVDNSGRGSTKFGKANDGITAYKTAEEAQAAALANAIADGAIQGLSAAVQKAFNSTSDVDRAVKEALGVKALEERLGGLGATLKGVFAAEDAAGKERLRLARTYGLDVVAVEKLNAEDRLKLVDDTLKSRVGSLNDFLDQLKFGDLAEGTATDKRKALLDQIGLTQADAEAGKDGAADKLAQLYGQLLPLVRDSFGTAGGEYSSDRANAQSGVERVIAMETQRVREAAGLTQATTAAVDRVAVGVDETNDLLARANAALITQNSLLQSLFGGTGGVGADYGITARSAALR